MLLVYSGISNDLTSITSAFMIVYWISQTTNDRTIGDGKTGLKSTSGISKQSIIIVCAVEIPLILITIVLLRDMASGNFFGVAGIPANIVYLLKSL